MKFYLSPEATSSIIHNIKLVGNTINGGYIALTEEGNKLLSQIESGCDINLEDLNDDMQELISALIELGIAIPTTARKNTFSSVVTATYLHITNNCNYNCKCCYSYDKKRNTEKDLTTEEIKHIISELSENGLEILAISGGEPFLREDLADILCYAKNDLHIKKIDIATNGSLVTSDVLASIKPYVDNIIVAIDGYSKMIGT